MRLGWNGMPLASRLRAALGVPVFVDNDISAVTVAERLYGIAQLGDLAAAGDARARELFADAGELLGRALAGVVNVLGTSTVVVIGEITVLWEYVRDAFDSALAAHLLPGVRDTRIEVRLWDERLIAVAAAGIALGAPLAAPRQRVGSGRVNGD